MEAVSEAELAGVTGRSGVAITIDDAKIYQHHGGEELWYQTEDAAVGIDYHGESRRMIHVNAIVADENGGIDQDGGGDRGLQGTYAGDFDFANSVDRDTGEEIFTFRPLTIKADDSLATLSEITGGGEVAGVAVGLPTVEIFTGNDSRDIFNVIKDVFDIRVSTHDDPVEGGDNEWSYGTIHYTCGNGTLAILDGNLEIAPIEAYERALE